MFKAFAVNLNKISDLINEQSSKPLYEESKKRCYRG
jgi:hypothetical protein